MRALATLRRLMILAASSLLSACASNGSACGVPTVARDDVPRNVTVLGRDLTPVREAFNAQSECWRVLALVSPTCSECVLGAEAVEKEITRRYPADRVDAVVVWIPMLGSDSEAAALASATIFPVGRAAQFYDSQQRVGLAYARDTFAGFKARGRKALPDDDPLAQAFDERRDEGPQWDLYMLYAPGVRWEESPPMPTYWMRHFGRREDGRSLYWRDSPDQPPLKGDVFEAMRQMADVALGPAGGTVGASAMRIEVLGFEGCPNTPIFVERIRTAARVSGLDAAVLYVDQEALGETDIRRGYPTPTALVNDRDLFGMPVPTSNAMSCRSYPGGVPTVDEIAARLRESR